jgi:hypothetical protein
MNGGFSAIVIEGLGEVAGDAAVGIAVHVAEAVKGFGIPLCDGLLEELAGAVEVMALSLEGKGLAGEGGTLEKGPRCGGGGLAGGEEEGGGGKSGFAAHGVLLVMIKRNAEKRVVLRIKGQMPRIPPQGRE